MVGVSENEKTGLKEVIFDPKAKMRRLRQFRRDSDSRSAAAADDGQRRRMVIRGGGR